MMVSWRKCHRRLVGELVLKGVNTILTPPAD
jgi:hypothetical protein